MPCPDPMLVADLALGHPVQDREGLLAHVAGCAPCRQLLADAAPDEGEMLSAQGARSALAAVHAGEARSPRRLGWMAAAAALLLAVSAVWIRSRDPEAPLPPSASGPEAGLPPGPFRIPVTGPVRAEAGDLEALLGRTGTLALREGSRARLDPARGAAELAEGSLWLEAAGEPLSVRAGALTVRIESGALLVERDAPPASAHWIRSALAADGDVRVLVLSGEARIEREGAEPLRLLAGSLARAAADGFPSVEPLPPGAPAWRGNAHWNRLQDLPRRLRDGTLTAVPADPGADYAWEAVLRRGAPATALSVCFTAGGKGWELPVGGPWSDSDAPLRVRVEVLGGWVRVLAGAHELLKQPASTLQGRLGPSGVGCGIRAQGGELDLLESRWRSL